MATETRITNEAHERLALAEPDRTWELWDGVLREKPGMTYEHNWLAVKLAHQLMQQFDWSVDQVRVNSGRVHRPGATYFIPDVFVLRAADAQHLMHRDDVLEAYSTPLPLIVEVWSRSTGSYDAQEKRNTYMERGDDEIWHVHPYERTVTVWTPDRQIGTSRPSLAREPFGRPRCRVWRSIWPNSSWPEARASHGSTGACDNPYGMSDDLADGEVGQHDGEGVNR